MGMCMYQNNIETCQLNRLHKQNCKMSMWCVLSEQFFVSCLFSCRWGFVAIIRGHHFSFFL